MRLVKFVTIIVCLVLSGCATMISSGPEPVNVSSEPPDAEVVVEGRVVGKTPTSIQLDAADEGGKTITIRKNGYKTERHELDTSLEYPAIFWDVMLGGWPLLIDMSTGAWKKFNPNSVSIFLQPTSETSEEDPTVQAVFGGGGQEDQNTSNNSLGDRSSNGGGTDLKVTEATYTKYQNVLSVLKEMPDITILAREYSTGVGHIRVQAGGSSEDIVSYLRGKISQLKVSEVSKNKIELTY